MKGVFSAVKGFAEEISVIENGQERLSRGFVQPMSVTSPENEAEVMPCGTLDGRRYLLIAAPEAIADGESGIEIGCGAKHYELLRCERLGGGHWEGIMRLKAGVGNA